EVDEVPDLVELVLHQPGAEAHVERPPRGDPRELANRAAARCDIMPEAQRDRDAPQRGGLLDRLIVLVYPMAEFRTAADGRVTDVEHDIVGPGQSDGNIGAHRRSIEIGAVEGELVGDERKDIAVRARQVDAATHSPRADRDVKQKTV